MTFTSREYVGIFQNRENRCLSNHFMSIEREEHRLTGLEEEDNSNN